MKLLEANSNYALIRDEKGNRKTVSIRDLAPCNEHMSKIENNEENRNLNEPEPSPVKVYSEDTFETDAKITKPKVVLKRLDIPQVFLQPSTDEEPTEEQQYNAEEVRPEEITMTTRSGGISRKPEKFSDYES